MSSDETESQVQRAFLSAVDLQTFEEWLAGANNGNEKHCPVCHEEGLAASRLLHAHPGSFMLTEGAHGWGWFDPVLVALTAACKSCGYIAHFDPSIVLGWPTPDFERFRRDQMKDRSD